MSYESSNFGDGSASGSGNVTTQVHTHFGAMQTDVSNGVTETDGLVKEVVIDFDGTVASNQAFPLIAPFLRKGAVIKDAIFDVTEVFVLGGTSPTILVGTDGTEVTNGLVITQAQAQALGTYDIASTLTGTWASPLAADTTVGIALGGTSPTSTSAGKGRLVVRYYDAR